MTHNDDRYRKAYYASISYTDYNIGQILNKLEAVGHKDDTIAIVFGDHGYQLGVRWRSTWAAPHVRGRTYADLCFLFF